MKNFYRDGGLIIAIAALIAALIAMLCFTYTFSTNLFWIAAPFITLVGGFAVGKLIQVTRKTFQYYARIEDELETKKRIAVDSFPMAAVVIDTAKKIVWCNELFNNEFGEKSAYGNPISLITDINLKRLLENKKELVIKYEKKYFQLYARNTDLDSDDSKDQELTLLFFKDITDYRLLQTEKRLSQPVVMLFMIDGYEELISGCLESEKAHVSVQIDKLLEEFVGKTNGILRKNGADRFIVVIEERYLSKIIEDRVEILDKAREIIVQDRANVTLSIGVGRTGKNLYQSENFAKQALEMALGRGGDQAAIKTKSGFEFYGGISKGIERHTKVKTRIIANALIDLVEQMDCVYIMGHKFSDLDSVGSSIGLTCAIRNLGKNAYAVLDKPSSLAKSLIKRFEEMPENEKSLFLSPSDALNQITDKTLLIIVDTHNPQIIESHELYEKASKVVIIDHHRKMVNHIDNAVIFHHEPFASSASEMVTELIQYFGDAGKLKPAQAESLLAGIMLDTKNFVMKTGVRTFEAAAFLRKMGADTITVKYLFANSIESYKRKTQIVATSIIYKKCAIAPCDFFTDDLRLVAPQAADELLEIDNVDASFVLYKTMNGEISISARSMGKLNVQLIMETLGGGGHQTMAGVQLKNISVNDAEVKLRKAIDEYYSSHFKLNIAQNSLN